MAHNPKSKMAIDRYNTLKVERQTWESHWQEVADYCLPRKADITKSRSKGDKRTEFIYDGTATHALELLAASLHGMLTNTVSPWFYLKYKNDELNKEDEAVEWLENCTQVMNQAFNRSNFQQEIFELYHDLIAFGTASLFISEDKENDLRFKNLHISEVYITENEKGFVDSLTRHFKMQAKNLPNQFPDAVLPQELVKKIEKNPYDRVNIIHCIHANPDYSENKKFVSHYVHEDSGTLLSEGFFADFPFAVPRYLKSSNEIYGRSPAMNALADIKMLNLMSKTSIKAAQKQIDPPLMVPDDGFLMPIRTVPGGLNYYRSGTRDRIEPMNIGANTPIGLNMEEQRRDAIRQNFFVDQLMTNQGTTMTATEVIQRNEEKMRILGPVLGRLQSELLQPLITRSFNILSKNKKFLPIPEMLGETDIEIEYVSPLAKAQKTGDLQALMRGIEIFGSLQQVSPVMDYLDTDNLVQYIKEVLGIPAKILKSRDQVALQRQDQEAQQMQQMQIQQEMQQAEIANKAAPMAKVLNESN